MNLHQRVPYATPAAFRRALTDRLRSLAAPNGPWPLADLQRQFGYDRLLARLYLFDEGWIVKGATALLARNIATRHTVDVDLYRATTRERAERDLRRALSADAGDWFSFDTGRSTTVADGVAGTRVPVAAHLGNAEWAAFHVDIVAEGVRMTGTPDDVAPLTPVDIPGLVRPHYRAYPIEDHVADKTCAVIERHGPDKRPSSRFKDLMDLVTLATRAELASEALHYALTSEATRRDIELPTRFDVPDDVGWEQGYAAEARRAVVPTASTLAEALAVVRPFLDPVLDGAARGKWHADRGVWA
jgi:Nucleotidyl transferase AbiEii toxin, Type IV TA system